MRIFRFTSETTRYTFYGIVFGLLFPILATSIDIARLGMEFSWKSILLVQKTNPIHYIIDTAPIFLGLFAMFGGKNLDKVKERNRQILKTSKFKEDFLANMSHEIRTPMMGVIGMIDLLSKNTKLDNQQKEYVSTIHKSSLNLLDILNQVLDLSKMEAGKLTLSPGSIALKDVINQNIDLFSASAKSKNIHLISKYSSELPNKIIADDNRLTQIISNLIGNAIKFTPKGNIYVHTSLISKIKDDLIIKIEVIDSGIGIDKKDQEFLFSRFSQFHDSSDSTIHGSGLGLTICKKLVDLMQGTLGVKSELGKGSNFWFTFKAKEIMNSEVNNDMNSLLTKTQKYNLHVLLVEDSEINILVSKKILEYLGCTVTIVRSGVQALQIFKENEYDLILMDINLPELDGLQTCNLIREKHKNVPPIIALTSNALPGDAELYLAKGMDDYITKPYTTEIMNIKLKKWFKERIQD